MKTATISNISTPTPYPLDTTNTSANPSFFDPHPDRQVREDNGFYVTELLSDAGYDADPKTYMAFKEHAKHLYKTEALIDDAWNLVGLMLTAIGDESDSRAMQTEAGLKVIEKKLSKAHNRIDRLDTRYMNLFLAYVDLKDKSGAKVE